jgi:hypothetical protein
MCQDRAQELWLVLSPHCMPQRRIRAAPTPQRDMLDDLQHPFSAQDINNKRLGHRGNTCQKCREKNRRIDDAGTQATTGRGETFGPLPGHQGPRARLQRGEKGVLLGLFAHSSAGSLAAPTRPPFLSLSPRASRLLLEAAGRGRSNPEGAQIGRHGR